MNDEFYSISTNASAGNYAIHPAVLYTQGTLTMLANVLFFITVLANQQLRTSSNYLLVSNSLADFLVGLYLLPIFQARWLSTDSRVPLKHTVCLAWLCVGPHLNGVSVAHWAVIAVERLIRVFHVQFHKERIHYLLLPAIFFCWTFPVFPTYIRTFLPVWGHFYPYNLNRITGSNDTCFRLTVRDDGCGFCVNRIASGSGAWTIETKGPWPPSKFGLCEKTAILPP